MTRKWTSVAAVFLIFVFPNLEATLASIKGTSMGGACVSFPLDSGVIAYNPAGIVFLCDRIDLSVYPVKNKGSVTVSGNADMAVNRRDRNTQAWVYSPEIGGIYHLHPDIAFGFALYNEIDIRTDYNRNLALLGTSDAGFEYTLEIMAPSVAVKIFNNHSVSATLNYMIDRVRLKGMEVLANTFVPISQSPHFVTNNGYNYSNGIAVTLGYQGHFFNDLFRIGFAWRSKASMKKFGDYKGFIAEEGELDIPEVYRAGVSVTPFCGWTFAFDYQLTRFEKIPALSNDFVLFTPNLLGSDQGSGFGWTNQNFYRFGINYDVSSFFSARVGFRHANLNFYGDNVAPNLLTLETVVDFLTCGCTFVICDNIELSGLFAYGFKRKISGDLPVPFGAGTIQLQKQTYVSALALSWYI